MPQSWDRVRPLSKHVRHRRRRWGRHATGKAPSDCRRSLALMMPSVARGLWLLHAMRSACHPSARVAWPWHICGPLQVIGSEQAMHWVQAVGSGAGHGIRADHGGDPDLSGVAHPWPKHGWSASRGFSPTTHVCHGLQHSDSTRIVEWFGASRLLVSSDGCHASWQVVGFKLKSCSCVSVCVCVCCRRPMCFQCLLFPRSGEGRGAFGMVWSASGAWDRALRSRLAEETLCRSAPTWRPTCG